MPMHVVHTGFPRIDHLDAVCIKFTSEDNTREVSIACDDSCGTQVVTCRADIRLYEQNQDVTGTVFRGYEGSLGYTNADMGRAMQWLNEPCPTDPNQSRGPKRKG